MSTKWNAADTTLLCAAFVFLASLGFHILNPNSIIAEGILFVAEAALVGGVADWFAVTALFKKPLGFPFHTAILPNRRQDFVDASVNMVQNEFFSRRSIFTKISNLHLLPKLVVYMKRSDIRASAIKILFKQLVEFISKLDKESSAKKIANEIRRTLRDVPPNILIHEVSQWIKRSEKDKQFIIAVSRVPSGKILLIRELLHISTNQFNPYRDRLLKSGVVYSPAPGFLAFALPWFDEYVKQRTALQTG